MNVLIWVESDLLAWWSHPKHLPETQANLGDPSVQFCQSVVSDSLWPHGLQHARLPYPSPTPEACSNSCLLGRCCHLILCQPLHLLPSIFPSIRVFSNVSVLHSRWPKYWSFSFSINHSNEYLGLIFFRMDWLDLLEVQGTLTSLLKPQFKSIIYLALSFLYGPTLTSTLDYWKKHSFDYSDVCWQNNVSAF